MGVWLIARILRTLTITPAYLTSSEKILYSQVKFTQEENLLDQILIKLYSYVLDSFQFNVTLKQFTSFSLRCFDLSVGRHSFGGMIA